MSDTQRAEMGHRENLPDDALRAANEHIRELEAERDRLRFALEVIRAGETLDPRRMADAALSGPSGE